MARPDILSGDSPARIAQGAVAGAILTLVVGFGWSGWTLGSTARTMADNSAQDAVVAALAPICVEQFQQQPNAAAKLAELKKENSWQQASFVENNGWSVMPGGKKAVSGVSRACANLLEKVELPMQTSG